MRMIDLIAGMSWESSAGYYRLLHEGVRPRMGATASPTSSSFLNGA